MSTTDPRDTAIDEEEGGSPADSVPELLAQDAAARAAAERRLQRPHRRPRSPRARGRGSAEAYRGARPARRGHAEARSDIQPESALEMLNDVFPVP